MLDKENLKLVERLMKREQRIINEYESYISQIRDPQTQIDIQKLLAQHKNQYSVLLNQLGDSNGV